MGKFYTTWGQRLSRQKQSRRKAGLEFDVQLPYWLRTHARILCRSPSFTCGFVGMGTGPHTPLPPAFTLANSLASAPLSVLYLAATSLNAGPTIFLSTPWQDM